jgi:hypothetical protein
VTVKLAGGTSHYGLGGFTDHNMNVSSMDSESRKDQLENSREENIQNCTQ